MIDPDLPYWTPDLVRDRLVEAAKLCQRTAGRVGPRSIATAWPAYAADWADLLGQVETGEMLKGGNQIRLGATSRQITLMEEAIGWQARYLAAWPGPSRCLSLFLASKALRLKFTVVCQRKGIPPTTAKARRAKALSLIAQGLTADGVEVR